MVDDEVSASWAEHDWNHVITEERANLFRAPLADSFPLLLDLPHANGDLGRSEAFNLDRRKNRISYHRHGLLQNQSVSR